jgi:hypothetical protein
MESQQNFIVRTRRLIEAAEEADLESPVEGYSGGKIGYLLASIAQEIKSDSSVYAEIGVFRGATLLHVAKHSGAHCVGIDNFSLFNPDGNNEMVVRDKIAKAGLADVTLINSDFELALKNWSGEASEIGLLFVDGPHDYRSQLIALLLAEPLMATVSAIVVDDANYMHVRQATWDFLSCSPGWGLLAEITTECHPAVQVDSEKRLGQRKGWSNGIHVLVRDDNQILEFGPQETRDLSAFYMSHDVFRHRLGPISDVALDYADSQTGPAPTGASMKLKKTIREFLKSNPGRTPSQNTDTKGSVSIKLANFGPALL